MSFQLMLPVPAESSQALQVLGSGTNEVRMSHEQSLCLVKIFLNASLGCICFARGLIPCDSPTYQDRRIDDLVLILLTSSPASYDDFFAFKGQLSLNRGSQQFKVLLRGKDKRADHILNLVESGVFDALEKGYLEAVQFSLSSESSRRQEVVECYTFSFGYAESKGSGRQVSNVKVTPASEEHFHVAGAQKSFRKVIRSLLVLCQELPALPRHRRLGVNLLYNSSCPLVYEPSGFASLADGNIFPTAKGKETVGAFQVGSYEVAMTVTNAESANQNANVLLQSPQKTDPTSSLLEDIAIRKQLQAMQRSSSIPSNLVLTQMARGLAGTRSASQPELSTATSPRAGSAVSVNWNSRRKRNVTAAKMAELIVQAWGVDMHNQSYIYLLDMDQLRKGNKIKRLNPGRNVNCECGSDHDEDAMTLCELCGLWQHDVCYGLQRYRPLKKPNEHFCYSCLLLPLAELVNNQMPTVVRMRLALSYIQDHNLEVVDRESLMKAVRLAAKDQTTYLDLVVELEDKGFIQRSLSNETYTVVKEEKKVTDARSYYLDPLACISDYYVAVKDKETARDRANAIQEALEQYADGRSLDVGLDEPELDEWVCEDAFGRQITRWGFYPDSNKASRPTNNRKRRSSTVTDPGVKKPRLGRKMSVSKTMINLDVPSDPPSDMDTDDLTTADNTSTG